ncbi:MAG: DNA gyrase subunit A [Geminocystis sp.]|nr:DNA gyrase subunit A [Geminocystis sp.]MCS7147419.1 DNA gyrase subunit A [Geminocystis sp.]MCX8079345.1 DNA gyrase subunit A [Geminocystis sp.]MDW8117108.1 DNA gyrase subunit A [Geminocystis sp.]HIK37366.1 DNA gyrase subunit A [Geminocystis sp. M7585_C2015_104]
MTAKERIVPTDLSREMRDSYLEYAMSVIVGRALPDARDGLKPVHRRILYAMYELGLTADRPFRKCARVVGEVLGKYHPHGDAAVYEALVRMAQDFSMREPLIDGHGNFGSIDNDPPAAMRYTECRLRALSVDGLLQDIEADTVDFIDNFDGSQREPVVLPARIPQLLLNGATGIAVGMATNIPPHNLGELIDGTIALIHNPHITDVELMKYIPGPDFPTGGQILGRQGIKEAYTTGRGTITLRGVADVETISRGRQEKDAIIITQLPFQTNKAALIEKIAELVNDRKIEGISDIRDESDRSGMRIVLELKREANPRVILNNLYKHTALQTNFGANMLALVGNKPQLLSLKEFLRVFLDFREEVITRRTRYHLQKAEEKAHILQGLLTALAHLDRVIELIRGADDTQVAKQQLVTNLQLSPAQAEAILQMQLRRLTALEAEKIESEYQQLQQQIGQLRDILASKERIYEVIEKELLEIKSVYATPRRTQIIDDEVSIEDTDLIANVPVAILLTQQGYLKKMPLDTFQSQNRATKGKVGASLKEDDIVEHFVTGSEHDTILFFSDKGLAYPLNAYQIPSHSRTARGVPIVQMLPIGSGEKITSIIAVGEFEENQYLIMLTEKGYIKKTPLAAFKNVRNKGLIAISLEQDDQLRWVRLAKQEDSILIGTKKGMAIHFHADNEQLRPLARNARGVKSMTLREGDKIVGMDVLPSNITANIAGDSEKVGEEMDTEVELGENSAPWALAVTTSGFGKRVPIAQFRLQKRGGMGVKAISFRKEGDELASLSVVHPHDEFMLITTKGMVIRCDVDTVSLQSRYASGVRLQRLEEDDAIAAVAIIPRQPFP